MEVFNATNNFSQNNSSFKNKVSNFLEPFKNLNKKQKLGFFMVFIIIFGIFISLGLSSTVQKFFSQAFMPAGSYGYGAYAAENYSGTLAAASPSPSPSALPSPITTNTPVASVKPGDTDGDSDIDVQDYSRVIRHFGSTDMSNPETKKADLNKNSEVEVIDYGLVISNFDK